ENSSEFAEFLGTGAITPEALDKIADGQGAAGTTVIVFDDRLANGASYYLLSHGLKGWHLKRLTRGKVVRKWDARQSGRSAEDRKKADRRWLDLVTLSVLDTLDQMEAIPWRISDWPYEACLAIDVGEGRRHFAMSLLICRGDDRKPSFARISESWPKGDHQRETINPVILRDKIVQLFDAYGDPGFTPLRSLLILRDGMLCGEEEGAIQEAIDRLKHNTVRQVITTVSAKVFFKGGRPRCSGRFLANLDILRLTTRGLTRLRRGSTRSWTNSASSRSYHWSRRCGVVLSHSGSRACRICRQPVNDNRSTSRFSRWAASSISARTTKWPSDKAYN